MTYKTPLSQAIRTTSSHLKRLEELGVKYVEDLVLFFPRTYEDKRNFSTTKSIQLDQTNNIKGRLTNITHIRLKGNKLLTKARLKDEQGSIEAVWFNQPYLKRVLKENMAVILSGKAKLNYGKVSLVSPLIEDDHGETTHTGRIVPIYHQTEGITSKWIREKLKPLISEWAKHFPEYMPKEIIAEYELMDYSKALKEAHFPTTEEALMDAKKRLSFDELFLLQLKALQKKWHWQHIDKHEQKVISEKGELKNFLDSLPFELTGAQIRSINEILEDINKPYPMARLVQGDVGSGKTIVAGTAIYSAILNGYQATLMAPTEILAKQHYNTLFNLFKPYNLNIQFISGSTPEGLKKQILTQLRTGTIDLIIGTHSLIQETVKFAKLGLAVIDEQHRFGVKQRDLLKSQGSPHLLSLTATPIPRTLAMTIYGDQDLSVIDELPKGRQEIITRLVPEKKRLDAYRWIEDQIVKGRQAFVICPLIDESDTLEVKSVLQEYEYLQEHIFKDLKVGLLHGKMKPQEKEEVMIRFKENKINILVSTSVIEVGIDVPNASIMLIEGAERFGLSQLHQFRGRVGRGSHQSYCFLFTQKNSIETTQRLNAMVKYASGFKLAEIDLSLRGPGEIFGVRQSGIPDLKMASLTDSKTISLARSAAQKIIDKDPLLDTYPLLKEKISELNEVYVKD